MRMSSSSTSKSVPCTLWWHVAAFLLWIVTVPCIVCLRREDGQYPHIPDYSEHYNYVHLSDKMKESLSISQCTMGGSYVNGEADKHGDYDLMVKVLPPPALVKRKWDRNNPVHKKRIFAQVNSHLCTSSRFKEVSRGFYKRAKGCYKVYAYDKKTGRKEKRFNDYGATLHPEHIRCGNEVFAKVCDNHGMSTGLQIVDPKYRQLYAYPFTVTAKNVIIGKGGMFALPCGPFGLFSSCEAVNWGVPFAVNEVKNVSTCRAPTPANPCPYPIYDKVFVLTQYDDTQIGQFMQENLPKLIYHLPYLKRNKDVKIHFGFTKQPKLPPFVLPHHFFAKFGLLDRLVNGTMFAKEVIMPREGGCQDIGYNAWEALAMRETFYDMLGIHEKIDFTHHRGSIYHVSNRDAESNKPVVLLLTRSAGDYTQNKADFKARRWTQAQLQVLLPTLQENFPNHRVEIFSDVNSTLMECPLCQAERFARADIVIGHHGAGLSNAIFMRPGGVLVEVVYHYDSRHAPFLGIFPRIADIIGLHHFSYFIRDMPVFDMVTFVNETAAFAKKTRLFSDT